MGHQCDQPRGLEHWGFAARICPGDHKGSMLVIGLEGNGNDRPAGGPKTLFQERMPGFDELESAVLWYCLFHSFRSRTCAASFSWVLTCCRKRFGTIDRRRHALKSLGKSRFCPHKVQF